MSLILEKKSVIHILEEIAVLLELAGENPFKSRAYSNAARVLESMQESLAELIQNGQLEKTKGIGKALEEKICTLATTGTLEYYDKLREQFPPSLFDLLKIPNLGPKKVKILYSTLSIHSRDELEHACRTGQVNGLPGFGEKTEKKILEGIERARTYAARVLIPVAEAAAQPLFEAVSNHPATIRSSLCGSLRRRRETIKDIDLLASSLTPETLIEAFIGLPQVKTITGKGSTKASVVLSNGMAADFRVVADDEFPFALNYFTGSKEHNTLMRSRAKSFGLRLNEYGLTSEQGDGVVCRDEEGLYHALQMDYIPPELREGRHEIDWAIARSVPGLMEQGDLKGTLHCHTRASDGQASLEEMAAAAAYLGYQYLGIGDHSKAAFYANGLDEKRLAHQWEEIDRYNQLGGPVRVLKGTEVDILRDGELDFAEEVLMECDFAVGSVHSLFSMTEAEMTQRLIRAIESPGITFLGHMTGRLLLQREPYLLDVAKVIDATARNGKWIEINSNPWRLDLDWRTCLEVRDKGILFCINPDAHDTSGISDTRYGIDVARKAGLSSEHIANTRSVDEFLRILKKTRSG